MKMRGPKISHRKLTAHLAVLAITILALVGLNGLLSMTSIAQEKTPPREFDLREKLKDKKFSDGRRIVIETLPSGEKILAEIKDGQFKNLFLLVTDGTEIKGEVKKKHATTTTTQSVSCNVTFVTTTTTIVNGKASAKTSGAVIVEMPCPANVNDYAPGGNSNSNANSNANSNRP